jgi:hypothetical protein
MTQTSGLRDWLLEGLATQTDQPPGPHAWRVNPRRIDGMQEVRGSRLLSSTTRSRVRCARCVPAALTGDRGLAVKLQVSWPTRDRAPGPSQGGSAGSNPVGATIQHRCPTAPGPVRLWQRVYPLRARVAVSDGGPTAGRPCVLQFAGGHSGRRSVLWCLVPPRAHARGSGRRSFLSAAV